ncbi:hypothetical protein B0H17DRAFT_1103389 [Mycena rosella]|uniref:Uncharacterized protein n=1 Tax=Mycena rosella TaxID=1033263 RepID=A0AAD7CDH3_MYCRO|nr:hypothetical protein B0H17DRAFT_1103389 [Mycena rosella]
MFDVGCQHSERKKWIHCLALVPPHLHHSLLQQDKMCLRFAPADHSCEHVDLLS